MKLIKTPIAAFLDEVIIEKNIINEVIKNKVNLLNMIFFVFTSAVIAKGNDKVSHMPK